MHLSEERKGKVVPFAFGGKANISYVLADTVTDVLY